MPSLIDLLRERAPAPDRDVVLLPGGAAWTAADLDVRAARMASALVALGVRPGDRVAAQVEKGPDVLALFLGCLRAGGVYLPLNTAYTAHEVAFILGDATPRVVVADPAVEGAARGAAAAIDAAVETLAADGTGSLAARATAAGARDDVARDETDLAAILYTSGTTGRPKGAMLTHGNLAANTRALVGAWRFTADDVLVHALPLYHVHGLFVATLCVLASGARMRLLPRFDADEVVRLLPSSTVLMGVPTFYTRLLAHPGLTREACARMRLFVSGSAPLLAETHRAFAERTGHAILERYGMTETGMNASNPYDGERRPGTVGPPLPGVEVRVVGEDGASVPAGEVGMIEVRGPNVFAGYWQAPERTAADMREDGYFVTGDVGSISADGYVTIVGRAKDLVITGGLNVYPKEVEEAIDELPGVLESAVIGVPHPDLGEAVTAVVVPRAGAALEEAALVAALRERVAGFKAPKRVLVVDDLPRNAMGKVQKNVLRERLADLYAPGSTTTAVP